MDLEIWEDCVKDVEIHLLWGEEAGMLQRLVLLVVEHTDVVVLVTELVEELVALRWEMVFAQENRLEAQGMHLVVEVVGGH